MLSDLELETFFKNLAVINRAPNHVLVLGCIWHDMGRVRAAMAANGYADMHSLVNVKPMQNTSGRSTWWWATRAACEVAS